MHDDADDAPVGPLDWPGAVAKAEDAYVRYADIYDALFGDLDDDADFYLKRAHADARAGGAILELGSGTGRVAERFLTAGFAVTGVDAS
jgi:hypothetical protein